ncbi:hypothetical protein C7Y68_08625 [Paracidovorax avenae]|uniref:helix-turn-helix domain-containing protein n=1 Tax=Paracidovorax avenae TaxID=80867 RepID=UPI000D162D6A|nr:helix-turn-helix domain-containing protein [Paracidovorax avenae]AVT20064.1 hypothetical protein C7Y68_08625 [Paracidovorax avenae]
MNSTTPEKAKGPTVAAVSPLKTGQSGRKSSARSPNSEAQRQRIIAALRIRSQTTEDLRTMGIFQAPARVKELRDRYGYDITTHRITVIDREGFPHPRAALYTLVSEPDGQQPQ